MVCFRWQSYCCTRCAQRLVTGVITAADDRHPGAYIEHDNTSDPVPIDDRMDYIDQHNYAYVLKRHRNVHVANYHAKLIFHLELPKWQVEFSEPIRNCANEISRTLSCVQLRELLDSVSDMCSYIQLHIRELMRRIYEVLTDLPSNTRRNRRGFFTDVISHVTGLATKDQLHAVTHPSPG